MAAVHDHDATGHETGCVGCEQEQDAIEVLRRTAATLRNGGDRRSTSIGLQEFAIYVGLYLARGDRVDAYVVSGQVKGHGAR